MKEKERNTRLLTLLDNIISNDDQESFDLIKTWIKNDTPAMQKSFELMEKSWEELKLRESLKGPIQHEDLIDIYNEEGFENDFEFIGDDGKIYKFCVDHFQYLMEEYRGEAVRDCISTVNGSIKQMVEQGICEEVKNEEEK